MLTNITTQSTVTPCAIAVCKSIGNSTTSNKTCRVLFDSGSSKTLIHKQIVPRNYTPISSHDDLRVFLLAGATKPTSIVALEKIRFPEFNCNIVIDKHPALIVDSMNLRYSIILGANFLDKCGITLYYENHQVLWLEYTIPLQNASEFFSFAYYTSILSPLELEFENDLTGNQIVDSFATCILDAKQEQANICDVAVNQNHLSLDQRCDLFNILSKHKKLFDGSIGVYPHKKVHIDLKPGEMPVHHRAYPVPHVHRQTFKKVLDHMIELGILEPCGVSEWASTAFIIPKKDGRV